jgi:hypothetical protein
MECVKELIVESSKSSRAFVGGNRAIAALNGSPHGHSRDLAEAL